MRAEAASRQVLALDPGPEQTGYVLADYDQRSGKILVAEAAVKPNAEILRVIGRCPANTLVLVEEMTVYGMMSYAALASILPTVRWEGKFELASDWAGLECLMVRRPDVRKAVAGSCRAKRPHVRACLIEQFSPGQNPRKKGTPLHGVTSHAWEALALIGWYVRTCGKGDEVWQDSGR